LGAVQVKVGGYYEHIKKPSSHARFIFVLPIAHTSWGYLLAFLGIRVDSSQENQLVRACSMTLVDRVEKNFCYYPIA